MNALRRFTWIFLFLALLLPNPAAAQSTCPAFPDVPWWHNLTHTTITNYVDRAYKGNWGPYIAFWENQLDRLRDIERRGSTALVTTDKIRLAGESLRKYGDLVEKRLAIMRCLAAGPKGTPTPPATAAIAAPVATDLDQGRTIALTQGCPACHGTNGIATRPSIPNLAGQSTFYLVKEIKEFQTPIPSSDKTIGAAARHDEIMRKQVSRLGESDVWNLASYFSALPSCPSGVTRLSPVTAPNIAATCVQCHGPEGQPVFPDVPVIAGQKESYLDNQLRLFRTSGNDTGQDPKWASRYHYFMSALAKSFSDADIAALARYFAGRPCP